MIYYSVHFNRPDFLEIQYELTGGKLVVINNHCSQDIEELCKRLGIQYYNLENHHHNSSSHGYALNFLKGIIDYSDDYCIMDHDLFPYREITLENYDIISVASYNTGFPYLWPGFIAAKKYVSLSNINFMPGIVQNGDTGCDTHKLIQDEKNKVLLCKEEYIGTRTSQYVQSSPMFSKIGDYAIHYHNGSNWLHTEKSVIEEKNEMILQTIKKLRCQN